MSIAPFLHQTERAIGELARGDRAGADVDRRHELPISRMEMRGFVLSPEHVNDHAEEAADLGHGRTFGGLAPRSVTEQLRIVAFLNGAGHAKALVQRLGRDVGAVGPCDGVRMLQPYLRHERRVAQWIEDPSVGPAREIEMSFDAVAEPQPDDVAAHVTNVGYVREIDVDTRLQHAV